MHDNMLEFFFCNHDAPGAKEGMASISYVVDNEDDFLAFQKLVASIVRCIIDRDLVEGPGFLFLRKKNVLAEDEMSFRRYECQLDELRKRENHLNNLIANWRATVDSLEKLGGEVSTLSKKSGDSLSESDSIMTDVNCLVSRLRDKYISIKRERDEIKSFLDVVDGNPD